MRGQLQALICLGSLAASSFPAITAEAATAKAPCRIVAAKPSLSKGMVTGSAARIGCDDEATLRIRIVRAVSGPDRTLRSGSRTVTNGRITTRVRCDAPGRYYVLALDYTGEPVQSRPAALRCKARTPAKTGAASTSEDQVVTLVNKARASKDCRPLTHDPKLHAAAERHSADMAARDYFSHTSKDGRSPGDRISAAGFAPVSTWGENIAMGQPSAAAVVRAWLNSPGHRANILNCSFTHIGVGRSTKGPYWTQDFAAH
ncbi:CAP domain-containing protein [Nonomuraea rhizosphaerae]|uniref:CAP domain-containing protein n=1 Tax=Nonomuraea rhizosphaerae TaxID=2665663 RepID=UPI001FEA87BE|nr:CAP domain-containing protein [Nonomuraea rhizosphaerae]